ncbi:MAG: hypothetical protein ACLUYS_06345 [Allobaculum sp.]|uniref:hypothetical protein n=1 Tax=Allobaculum sp. TaxID=1872463 RepID=UPI00399BECEF
MAEKKAEKERSGLFCLSRLYLSRFVRAFEKYEDLRKMLQKTETVFQRKVARVDISATIVFRQRGKRGRSGTACRELLTPVKEKQSEPL